jgi:hypothetical protein
MASASNGLTINKLNPNKQGIDLKREARFTLNITIVLILDGIPSLVILGVLELLNKAIALLSLPDGNMFQSIFQYSHYLILGIYLVYAIIHVSTIFKDRLRDK